MSPARGSLIRLNQFLDHAWFYATGNDNLFVGNQVGPLYVGKRQSTAELVDRINNMNPTAAAQAFLEEADPHTRAPALNALSTARAANLLTAMATLANPDPIADNVAAMEYDKAANLLNALDYRLSSALIVRMPADASAIVLTILIRISAARAAGICAFISAADVIPRTLAEEPGARYMTRLLAKANRTVRDQLLTALLPSPGAAHLLAELCRQHPVDTIDTFASLPPGRSGAHLGQLLQTDPGLATQLLNSLDPVAAGSIADELSPLQAAQALRHLSSETVLMLIGHMGRRGPAALADLGAARIANILVIATPEAAGRVVARLPVDLAAAALNLIAPRAAHRLLLSTPDQIRPLIADEFGRHLGAALAVGDARAKATPPLPGSAMVNGAVDSTM